MSKRENTKREVRYMYAKKKAFPTDKEFEFEQNLLLSHEMYTQTTDNVKSSISNTLYKNRKKLRHR